MQPAMHTHDLLYASLRRTASVHSHYSSVSSNAPSAAAPDKRNQARRSRLLVDNVDVAVRIEKRFEEEKTVAVKTRGLLTSVCRSELLECRSWLAHDPNAHPTL